MANSGRISKRPILPVATGRSASTCGTPCPRGCDAALLRHAWCRSGGSDPAVHLARHPWRDCTRLRIAGGRAHDSGILGAGRAGPRAPTRRRSDTHSAPTVGGPRGADQHIAELAQFGRSRSLVERCGDVLGRASDLVDAVREVGRIVSGQHHRVSRHRGRLAPVDRRPLLVGPLPAGLAAILTAPAQPDVGHVSTTPAARLRAGTAGHACRL